MVKKILALLGKEIAGLHEAAYLLALATFISLALALVRDKLLAYFFGAGHLLDIYYASFRLSDMIYATIASTVAASVLVPFLIKKNTAVAHTREGETVKNGERHFIDHVFSIFFWESLLCPRLSLC